MEINLTVVNSGAHCYIRFRCYNVPNSRFVYLCATEFIHLFIYLAIQHTNAFGQYKHIYSKNPLNRNLSIPESP